MTITAEQIPDEVVKAAARRMAASHSTEHDWERFVERAKAVLAAALAAWPRQREDYDLGEWSLILPIQQEKRDDRDPFGPPVGKEEL